MQSHSDLSPEELARRWQLVVTHRQYALKVARARTASLADAEDIASEALARAVQVDELRPETVSALLSTIVARLVTDLHRRETTRRRHESSRSGDGRGASVEEKVVDAAEARWLARRVAKLAVREREVLLHRAAGHTNASAADSLGLTYKSVESAYTRARYHLQLAWQTTLGIVLGVVLGATAAVRRLAARSQPAFAATSMALTALALIVAVHQVPLDDPALQFSTDDAQTTTLASTGAADRSALPAAAVGQRSTGAHAAPTPSPSRTTLPTLVHEQVGDPDVASVEATLTGDLFESPTASVDRCMSKGIYVGPEGAGCTATIEADGGHPTPTPGAVFIVVPTPSSLKDHA